MSEIFSLLPGVLVIGSEGLRWALDPGPGAWAGVSGRGATQQALPAPTPRLSQVFGLAARPRLLPPGSFKRLFQGTGRGSCQSRRARSHKLAPLTSTPLFSVTEPSLLGKKDGDTTFRWENCQRHFYPSLNHYSTCCICHVPD